MVRVTVRDPEKIVSFTAEAPLVPALVAACAAEPRILENLLLAVEPYRPGTVACVMHALLHADTGLETEETVRLFEAFEAVDPSTRRLAYRPDREGLLAIDLERRVIEGVVPGGDRMQARGSVETPTFDPSVLRETVYALGPDWTVHVASPRAAREERLHA